MGANASKKTSASSRSSVMHVDNMKLGDDLTVEIRSDASSSGTTTPPVIIDIASGKEESEAFISKLNKKLTEEHKQIIQKIEEDLEKSKLAIRHHTQDSQTDGDETASVASAPVTRAEFQHIQQKQAAITKAEEAQKALETQLEEINALRATMLGEYEQMLSVRAEVMASQSEEVEKLQKKMAQIQQQYENQMTEFEEKVHAQAEASLKASHEKELEEMKQYYEAKVSEMEESYTTDIAQLKQEHAELLARLQQEGPSGIDIPSPQELGAGKHREYVRKTTMLTAISDEDETPESTPPGSSEVLEGRIKVLEGKLKEKEKLVEQLKQRLEAEATSAEDLHGKLLDSNKTLDDFEENLKLKAQEIEELKNELTDKDKRISDLESEKAALEEKGEKDKSASDGGDGKVIKELKDRIKKLEEELTASKTANVRIQEEMNQLDAQHGEAIMKLKEEMESSNRMRIEDLEASFKIQLEEELNQQAEDLDNRYKEQLDRQNEELKIYKKTESELKQRLDTIQTEHQKQLDALQSKIATEIGEEQQIEVKETMETQMASPTETVDRDSIEAAIRENVRAEILQEYEESIDKLKSEYEEQISDLSSRIQSFETKGAEREEAEADREKELSDSQELEVREKLRAELALEFKEKLQTVTDEYESKLKKLQDIVDSKKDVKSPPYALARSRSLDTLQSREKEKIRSPSDYEGYVSTVRREYEDKINSLQMQIAQYRSTVGSVPSSPQRKPIAEQHLIGDGAKGTETKRSPYASLEIPIRTELGTSELRQEIYDEIAQEFEASFRGLQDKYEKQLEEVRSKLEELQSGTQDSYENRIREEVVKEYEGKIAQLKAEYEQQIAELKAEHEQEVIKLNEDIEKAKAEKLTAEKKVKADMFVWHEEMMREQKNKHEKYESQLRKEYEEKMELVREELQENFDAEKENLIREHKQELVDMEDRYENLIEDLRTGEGPEVAQMVQQKYDMELEMARTLIQQECEETLEAEQQRLTEQFEKQLEEVIAEREQELKEQGEQYQKEMDELRKTLLEQYETRLIENENKHKAAMNKLKADYEALLLGSQQVQSKVEKPEKDIMVKEKVKALKSEPSEDSSKTDEKEKEEETEKVASPDSASDKSDKSDEDDDKDGGKGGARVQPSPATSADTGEKHEQEKPSEGEETEGKDETDTGETEVTESMDKVIVKKKEVSQPGVSMVESEETKGTDETDTGEVEVTESVDKVTVQKIEVGRPVFTTAEDSNLVQQLRKELQDKIEEYETTIAALKSSHAEEVRQLQQKINQLESEYEQKIVELEDSHEEAISKLREGIPDDSEALEIAHQQELQDLEDRLVEKHMNELNNLETQYQSRLDDLSEKYQSQIEQLQEEVIEAKRAMEQYPDVVSPEQTVPTFHLDSTMGSTKETEDFMARTPRSQSDSDKSESQTESQTVPKSETMETQRFEARSMEDRSEEVSQGEEDGSLQGTLEEVGVQSLDDTSMDQSRGTLRGVDTTQDTELIQFSEEDEEEGGSDKSMEEGTETQKSDRSTPTALMQTLGYGAEIPAGPTVKSLDDTTDSSIMASGREEMVVRIKELEAEVEDLRNRLKVELSKQDEQMERFDREKSEESNLVAMLRGDIERLNSDRDALQGTNEHLLGLLSESVKNYMSVEESITKKMKVMMEKSEVKGRPGSGERKRTPPPGRKPSPATSPSRLSPARAEEGDNQDTSIASNVTDEGLDLSQRISDSIFQGPELTSEEEELLTDSGSRLRSSVSHLLDMIEETTSQLLETRQTQVQMMETLEGKGHDLEQMTSRCNDLEERLKEEVERKDFLALELHKAEGLIEGYSSEHESLNQKIQDLEEHKETLVLELETTRNKLLDLEAIQSENERLRQEMTEQRELISGNVGEDVQALMLEVSRLNSENREKDEQIKQVHDRFESRVRELESSGEDMESHYGKLVDEKKQEVADLKLQVEALEKQLKAKKKFIEEQSTEREQEHDEYQKELDKWKKNVQDLEKQNGAGSRLQREIDDLTEQLQSRIDQHNQALLESEKFQREAQDKELTLKERNSIIQQLEQELQEKMQELESARQKVQKLEEELSRRPDADDDLSDSTKSDIQSPKPGSSLEFDASAELKHERTPPQMTVEEEMRQAANKTKEELVREKFTLQTQVNEHLVHISSLRNQLDEMRHRRAIGDVPETVRTLELEREKSEEKDKEISELKIQLEAFADKVDNRDQQIEQLREKIDRGKLGRGSPVEGIEFESDRELEKQIEALKRENKQLRERVKLSEASSVTDMSGLSQNLLEEKNQEIDHLSEQILRLQSDFNDLKAEKGVQNLYEEIDELQDELKKEQEIADSVRVSQAFTDNSLTPDSSLINVGASFSEKASIQQEMEESVARNLEKMASLESEVTALKAALHNKEEQLVSLETELSDLREDLQGKDEMILALQTKPAEERELLEGMPEDPSLLQAMIQEKEELITQLTVQVDSLQAEVDNLMDFQSKLQEDFDTVQTMLEEKDREIESLTKELTDRSPTQTDEHSQVIKHEIEIARLKKELREKDNVVEEKMEEIAEVSDRVELLESESAEHAAHDDDPSMHIARYKEQIKNYDEQVLSLERELKKTKKQLDAAIQQSPAALTADEKDQIISEKTQEIERLNRELETVALGRPPSPPLSQDEKSELISKQKEEIESLKQQVQKLLGKPPSPPPSEDEKTLEIKKLKRQIVNLSTQLEAASLGRPPTPPKEGDSSDVVVRLRAEIERLKQQIMDANLTEDDKFVLIRDLRLENETLKKQIDAALKIRPPSPPLDEDEKSELIREQKKEIQILKSEIESASRLKTELSPRSGDEKDDVIIKQEKEIKKLRRQVDEALKIPPPPPPMSEDEREKKLEEKETEVIRLTTELTRVTEAIRNGEEKQLVKEKIEESVKLRTELDEVKQKLESLSSSSIESVLEQKEEEIAKKTKELRKAKESIEKLEEELHSAKEVRAYEDEIELKEKQDEIEELQAELETYRRKSSDMSRPSVDLETSLTGDIERRDSADLMQSLSFYKDQYDEKCSESRQLQVQLDLVRDQLEKARMERLGDAAQEEVEIFKAEVERKVESKAKALESEKDTVEKENKELKRELEVVKEQLHQTADERLKSMERELEFTKDELAKERKDNVQTINDMEKLRERKEKERRDSVKTIQELEHDLEEKVTKEKQLNIQVKQLSEELSLIKKQYGIEDKAGGESRTSPKSLELRSQGSFELGTDVETLQQQVLQYKQQADKAREILADKQKYQSQVVKLEIQYEKLQKQMKKEVSQLEEQLKAYAKQPDYDVWTQLHATQERLEKTTEKLQDTSERLNETDAHLQKVSSDLASREADLHDLQQDLWKTSGQLSLTSGKLQETEERLRQTLAQVLEREEQIHQLQGELQHTQEAAQVAKKAKEAPEIKPGELDKLRKQLKSSQDEVEALKKSLNEAVEMSEQQLHMVENKDQEYVKLKLDIQQTLAEKEKVIKDQRNKIKEKEQELKEKEREVTKARQEVEKQKAAAKKKESSESEVAALRAQLENQEEVILTLESNLREARTAVTDREKEIDNIHQTSRQSRDDQAETIQAMHNQIGELQQELQVLRSAAKAQGQRSRTPDDFAREATPYNQNANALVRRDQDRAGYGRDVSRRSPEPSGLSPEQPYSPASRTFADQPSGQAFDDQEDSGHQSFEPQSRELPYGPEGQSLSPRDLRAYNSDQGAVDEIQRSERSVVHSTQPDFEVEDLVVTLKKSPRPGSGDQVRKSPSGSRPGSGHSDRSQSGSDRPGSQGSARGSPHSLVVHEGVSQAYSPPTRDSPRLSDRGEGNGSHRSSYRGSPSVSLPEQKSGSQKSSRHSSPAELQDLRSEVQRSAPRSQAQRSPPGSEGHRSPSRSQDQVSPPRSEGQRSPPRSIGLRSPIEQVLVLEQASSQRSSLPSSVHSTESMAESVRLSSHGRGDEPIHKDERTAGKRISGSLLSQDLHDEGPHRGRDRSPRSSDEELDRRSLGSRGPSRKDKTPRSSQGSTPTRGSKDQRKPDERSPSRRNPYDDDDEDDHRRGHPPRQGERQGAGASFTIDEERQVYTSKPVEPFDDSERYIGEDGQLYDRDGNIRPKYSQVTEGRRLGDHAEGARSPYSSQGRTQRSQDSGSHRGQGSPQLRGDLEDLGQGQSEGHGVSLEADRYIQQLRRELLITKAALMQIQRGERLDGEDIAPDDQVTMETTASHGHGDRRVSPESQSHRIRTEVTYDTIPSEENLNRLKRKLEKAEEELELYRSSSDLSARDFVQKVMNLKDELASEHQRHIQELSTRAKQDTETQLATMRIKYTDEIDHLKKLHTKELEEKLRDQKQKLDHKHKSEMNKVTVKHQEELGALRLRAGVDMDETSVYDRQQRQRQDGVGADRSVVNGHGGPMSEKLQGILRRLHNEGVQVLTISELEFLNRSQTQSGPPEADVESMKAGWENERQTMLSTIQSLKDLLAQTHKVRGLDKALDSSDWRAELLRAIGYVFTRERESLLAELRSHVLSYPSTNLDETQRLEQKIRNLEAHHHAALEQIFNADRQSMLAEIRDLRAHATIARMHQQEERDRMNEKVAKNEDTALKKERQLKREVQLLEFKIQQEKVLRDDLRASLDSERNHSGELSGLLNQEKTSNLDLQTTVSALQTQVAKLRENLEREQSRYVSVTNALEEEKSKSLNLSDLLESERETLWRAQAELEALKQQHAHLDPRAVEQLQAELNAERERRCQADSQHEIDMVTMENLKQEVEMGKRHQHSMEAELGARISQLQRTLDMERQKLGEINRALDRERSLSAHLQQSLEAEKSNSERTSSLQDLEIQLQTERANLDDLNRALEREQKARDAAESEKSLLKDHLNQERAINEDLKREVDKLQFERLEAVNKLQKERDMVHRLKSERDQMNDDLRKAKSLEIQRDQDRVTERLSSKKSVKDAEREKEEYRMKLHEQELETQRLTQKVCGLEEQLAESQENELKTIRELEKLKLDTMQPTETPEMLQMSAQTSPRPDVTDGMSYEQRNGHLESCQVYRSQLESMCQSLHYLILRCREQLGKATHSSGRAVSMADFDELQRSLRGLLSEVKQLQELEGDFMTHPSGSVNERILRQNEELTNFVARISEEKTELRNTLTRLEEEIWRYRQMDAKYQEMQRLSSGADHQLIAERSEWAKEKLSLQMALNAAEREIDLLQTDLRVEREKRVASGITDTKDTDKIKIQRLYGKYLRAESFRKALIYQKKYLLLLLGGYQDTEESTLALLSRMGAVESSQRQSRPGQRSRALTMFRGAVRVIIAIQRMKFLVKKWRRATRVGSDVVGGTVDQTNGYVPQANGYSPPRSGAAPRASSIPVRSSSSPPAWTSSYRQPSPSRATDNTAFFSPRYDTDSHASSSTYLSPRVTTTSYVPYTPPTKDYSSTTRYTSPSSGARRKILTSTSIPAQRPSRVRFTAEDSQSSSLGETDDYISRLESLQTRLGTLQNGKKSGVRQAWR